MTDINTTQAKFDICCNDEGCKPHPYITKMLRLEREDVFIKMKNLEKPKTEMRLFLGGNNHILTDERIQDVDAKIIYKMLSMNFYVTQLDLRYNNIKDKGAIYIAELIKENEGLTEINLMFNDFGADGACAIANALHVNRYLLALRLTGCKIGDKGGMAFAQALQVNSTLQALDLGDTDLKISSVVALATILHTNSSLKALNVNRPLQFSINEELPVHFANMLKVNSSLEELCLQKYDMRDFGMTRLCENLQLNNTLTYLDLSNNRITRDGAKILGELLKLNTALQVVDLSNNRIMNEGAVYLSHALATYNTNLTTLVVVSNDIGTEGLCALADSLRYNGTITHLYIWGNTIEEPTCVAFSELLNTHRLQERNVDVRPYVVDDVTYLSQLTHGIHIHYYWAPSYGEDVPSWHPRSLPKDHPRDPGLPLE